MSFSTAIWVLTVVLLSVSAVKDPKKTKQGLKKAGGRLSLVREGIAASSD